MGLSLHIIHLYISITPNQKKKNSAPTGGRKNEKLKEQLLKFLNDPSYRPLNKSELARALEVTPKRRQQLRQLIADMESEGTIRKIKKGRYVKRGGAEMIGIIQFHTHGNAFVDPENSNKDSSLFIPKDATGTALHGDKVVAKIMTRGSSPQSTKNIKNTQKKEQRFSDSSRLSEGQVIKVLERKNGAIIATYQRKGKFVYAQPDNPLLPATIELDPEKLPAKLPEPRNKVVIAITDWISRKANPKGHIVKDLGPPDTPGIDILQIIYAHKLSLKFPEEVTEEANNFSDHISEEDIQSREDWRKRPVFTIDPDDARDFDDAILVEKTKDGNWELAVHIADVAHYVRPKSLLDKEAYYRGNSTYLADRVIPMLPEKLSNGLCSLVPEKDRLTHAAVMQFNKNGTPKSVRFCKAVINSARRFTYKEAYALMQKPDPQNPFSEKLSTAWELAKKLRERRFKSGALELDMPEVRAVLDKNGKTIRLEKTENDESHQLIEEFMLAANEAVAKHIKEKMKPSVYRIHEDPDSDKLFEFRQLVLNYGFKVGDLDSPNAIQSLLKSVQGRPEEHAIKVGLLKSMKRATYSEKPIGHYGLSKTNYTHFTSPIRRYADLIVHRVLASVTGAVSIKTPKLTELNEISKHLSGTERNSASAEMESQKLKQLEFLWLETKDSGDSPTPTHPAIIHNIRRKGLFIELTDHFIKGLVPEHALPHCRGGYWFDGSMSRFVGSKPKRIFEAGQEILVTVDRVDLDQRLVDFKIVDN
jgi:ribonuclease R